MSKSRIVVPKDVWNIILKHAYATNPNKWLKTNSGIINLDHVIALKNMENIITLQYGGADHTINKSDKKSMNQVQNYLKINLDTLEPLKIGIFK